MEKQVLSFDVDSDLTWIIEVGTSLRSVFVNLIFLETFVEGQPFVVRMSDIVYLFVELDKVVGGRNAKTGDTIVQPGLLRITVLNTDALSGHSAFAEAGNFIKDMVHQFGSSLFDTFQSYIGRSTHSLISQRFCSGEVQYALDETGD